MPHWWGGGCELLMGQHHFGGPGFQQWHRGQLQHPRLATAAGVPTASHREDFVDRALRGGPAHLGELAAGYFETALLGHVAATPDHVHCRCGRMVTWSIFSCRGCWLDADSSGFFVFSFSVTWQESCSPTWFWNTPSKTLIGTWRGGTHWSLGSCFPSALSDTQETRGWRVLCLNSFQNCSKDSLAESDDYLNTCQHLNHFESFDLMPTTPRFSSWILDLGSSWIILDHLAARFFGHLGSSVQTLFRSISGGFDWGDAADALRPLGEFWVLLFELFVASRFENVQSLLMLLSSKSQVCQVFRIPKISQEPSVSFGDELGWTTTVWWTGELDFPTWVVFPGINRGQRFCGSFGARKNFRRATPRPRDWNPTITAVGNNRFEVQMCLSDRLAHN